MANIQAHHAGTMSDPHQPAFDSADRHTKKPSSGSSGKLGSGVGKGSQDTGTTNEEDAEEGDSSGNKEKKDLRSDPDMHASSGVLDDRPAGHITGGDTTTPKAMPTQYEDSMELDQVASQVPSVATSDLGDDDALIQQRMAELEAMGWRPEEEAVEIPDDDDDYNDVDAISESDEGDARTRQEEDMMLSNQDLNADEEEALVRRLSLSSAGSDFAAFGISSTHMFAESPFLQSQFMFDELESDNLFGGTTPLARKISEESNDNGRRVRFEDEIDHSDAESADSEQVESFFPDLFVQQDHLDPNFRQVIENDQDLYLDDASDTGSYWDYDGDELRVLMMDNESSDSDSSAGSSGYESDDGDTTEEGQEPMPPPPPPKKLEKKQASPVAAGSATSTPKGIKSKAQMQKRTPVPKRTPGQRMPKMGTFIIDPDKPVLTIDGTGRNARHILWPARNQTPAERAKWNQMCSLNNTRNNSPRGSVQLTPAEESDSSNQFVSLDMAPFLDQFDATDVAQAIAPQDTIAAPNGGDIFAVSNNEEDPLDFLNFGDEDDEDDEDMPEESDNPLTSPTASTPFPHYKAKGTVHDDLLAHFDRLGGAVGSFRRNQQFARHVGSLPSHPALRNATSESNAMQTGRRAAANTPITPLRKKRIGKDVGHRNNPLSPLSKSPVRRRNRSHSLRH